MKDNLLEQIKKNSAKAAWYFGASSGWVVIPWTLLTNELSSDKEFVSYIELRSMEFKRHPRSTWSIDFTPADAYIKHITSPSEKQVRLEELRLLYNSWQAAKTELEEQRNGKYRQVGLTVIQKHEAYLERVLPGMSYPGARQPLGKEKDYENACHSCGNEVTGGNLRCAKCNWVVCQNCGACGCGTDY